jgi:hypothetical protein
VEEAAGRQRLRHRACWAESSCWPTRPYRHIHFAAGLIGVEVGVCPQVDMN